MAEALHCKPACANACTPALLQVLLAGLCQQLLGMAAALAESRGDNEQLAADASALASDLQLCATNLQSLVATVAFAVPGVCQEVQQGLNAKDAAVFDEQLAALHQVRETQQGNAARAAVHSTHRWHGYTRTHMCERA